MTVLQWFSHNSIWILMLSALALAILVFARPRLHARMERLTPDSRRYHLLRAIDTIIAVLDGAILVVISSAAVAITLSREGPESMITPETVRVWVMEHGLLILLIIAIAYLVYRMLRSFLPNIVESSMSARGRGKKAREELARRVQTLSGALATVAALLIILVAVFMVLSEIGVDVTPLLATAGVAGIAVGFGAQSLIKDLATGLFILLEDQYNRGDVVKVAGITGVVEDVTLKRTILRDLDGIVHSIPNGEITTASNYTKQYARINLDVPVAYGEDLDHCIEVINRVGLEMYKDPAWAAKMRSAPQSLGVNKFGDSGIDIKVLGDTKPMMQWEVSREFRRRIKRAFDQEHIEIPWPHVKLYYGDQAPQARITCPSCGHGNTQDSKFCVRCGASLEKTITPDEV
ncbi:MAG: mechanosensitive ion channel [Dehalococcoidia bacterium]|nr:mechanosensitive ion channel [Dehalococcoidia bacterium]